jgi:hypothetical protein
MPRRQPISEVKILKSFPTKAKALEFMNKERERFAEGGLEARFDVKKEIGTGRWIVTRQDF